MLYSDLTRYYLTKAYGLNNGKVSRLRNGKNSVDDISLSMAEKFEIVYDKEHSKTALD